MELDKDAQQQLFEWDPPGAVQSLDFAHRSLVV